MVEHSSICNVIKFGDVRIIRSIAQNLGQFSALCSDREGYWRGLQNGPNFNGPSPRAVVTPDKLPLQHSLLVALSAIESRLIDKNVYLIAASIFVDRGQGTPTLYHNDLWFSAPFTNRVLQLWIPIACYGAEEDIHRSMLRVDKKNKLEDNWGVPYGLAEYCQLYTGERRRLPFATDRGLLESDPDVIKDELVGGSELSLGDVLCFDNSYCHYTLPSNAHRAALSMRMTWGPPTYSGYFLEERPLDGLTATEANRKAQADVCKGYKIREVIPAYLLRRRGSFREYPRDAGGSEFADALLGAISIFF